MLRLSIPYRGIPLGQPHLHVHSLLCPNDAISAPVAIQNTIM